MNTVTLAVSLKKEDFNNMITRYHFQQTDKPMLQGLYQALSPLLDIHACYLSTAQLSHVDLEQYAAVFLTLGDGIDALQNLYLQSNHVSEAYMLECIGMELLTKAYEAFAGKLQKSLERRAVRMHFIGDTYPYSIMDEMREKMGEINISFNAQYSMTPQKSVAYLLELAEIDGKAYKQEYAMARSEQIKHTHNTLCHVHLAHMCADCKNVDCEYRQKENYTYGYQTIFGGKGKKG